MLKHSLENQNMNIERMQNVLLIWLDSNIDETDEQYQNSIVELQRVVNIIYTYTNNDRCMEFIETIQDHRVCMIISGYLGQDILPYIHNMSQIDSIFIFCGNKKSHEHWAQHWSKIKGVFTEIKSICEALRQSARQCEQNAMSVSFVASDKKLDQLDPSFMYTQILKEILSTIKFDDTHIQSYLEYCRGVFAQNKFELNNIKDLERIYHEKTPIWWYSCESFLYPMLNRAIRMMNGDIMIRMGFFINDLHRQIEQLHKVQDFTEIFTVYRGQGLSGPDFEQLKKTNGGLMSFNNFLSTSKVRKVSLSFAEQAARNPDLIGILFMITIDPKQSTTPFASIRDFSALADEEEVLFSMHSVFRIQDMKQLGENNRLFEVNLMLTNDNDKDLNELTDYIREESYPHEEGWARLGLLLKNMGQNDKAEEIFQTLLDHRTEDEEKGAIYHELAMIKDKQAKYREALSFYEKSLAIKEKIFPPNDFHLAVSYNNIGLVYFNMKNYTKALSFHEKALAIRQQSLPSNHLDLAMSYNNIGLVYSNTNHYSKALSYYEKALEIAQHSLPSTHPHLAASYNNIGSLHENMRNYSKALSYYEKCLEIKQQSLPSSHPDLALSYNNIGLLYEKMKDYPKARLFFERAVLTVQQSLPSNHPWSREMISNFRRVKAIR
ncbi:unnamed protein product [Adineta ricciae]|uniref:ADP ribosyltransferase domain-containing protein n=1 Tax=Adineta ricciae TaxID=249248 RepID=A0A815TFJ1_ADIRI|nr:unnamed protein product [Adineta ricciae]